jgi:L,D-peptidoglycan transpeptidase YkuD (ErfK/YbiS/YcfS/YnhG family)
MICSPVRRLTVGSVRLSTMLPAFVLAFVLVCGVTTGTADAEPLLPGILGSTVGGTQLITAVASGAGNRTGTLTWWQRTGRGWREVGSAPARFGVRGLSAHRLEGDGTTPEGVFPLVSAFGIRPDPGTRMPWRAVDGGSWWDGNSLDGRYNSWVEDCSPSTCWESATNPIRASEHLADHRPQYDYAVVIGFNPGPDPVRPPGRPSGAGIFLHVDGVGPTAGCISIPRAAMIAVLRWLTPDGHPQIAIGTTGSIGGYRATPRWYPASPQV